MRLTKKEKNKLASNGYRECDYLLNGTSRVKALNKLGQLEDIEEEFDLDLRILLTLLKERKGWFLDVNQKPRICYFYDLPSVRWKEKYIKGCIESSNYYYEQKFYFKDYGKTWSLNKSDLLGKEGE